MGSDANLVIRAPEDRALKSTEQQLGVFSTGWAVLERRETFREGMNDVAQK